jgi:hypothetical protein
MVQVVENHQMLLANPTYQMALAHSIGGPINNNVVTLLEKTEHYQHSGERRPFKPTVLPKLAEMKPKGWSLETIFAERDRVKARFQCATTRFNRAGEPLNSLVLIQTAVERKRYELLIGTGAGQYENIHRMRPGQEIRLERKGDSLTLDEVPIQRIYRKTMEGLVEIADSAWNILVKRRSRLPVRAGTAPEPH